MNRRIAHLPFRSRGITLLELMTVLVILGILTTIAVNSYRNYLLRSNRTEARIALLRVQTAQEKFFLQNNRYADDDELTSGLGIPATTSGGLYTITLETPDDATTYEATATAANGQTADDPACHTLTINQLGERTPTGDQCWR